VKNGGGQIMMNQPGKDPVPLTITQIAELLRNQQEIMAQQEARIRELEFMNQQLQGIIVENAKQQKSMPLAPISNAPCAPISNAPCAPISNDQPWIKEISKSEPLFRIN
jgi:hypothetical protein